MSTTAVRELHALSAENLAEVHADEARLERFVAIDEAAIAMATAYALFTALYEDAIRVNGRRLPGVVDLRWRRGLSILGKGGTRALAALDELRALTPDGAA